MGGVLSHFSILNPRKGSLSWADFVTIGLECFTANLICVRHRSCFLRGAEQIKHLLLKTHCFDDCEHCKYTVFSNCNKAHTYICVQY